MASNSDDDNKENQLVYHAKLTGVQPESDCDLQDFSEFVMAIAAHVPAPEHDDQHYLMRLRFEAKEDADKNNDGQQNAGSRVDAYHYTFVELQEYCARHHLGQLRSEHENRTDDKLRVLVDAKWRKSGVRKVVDYRFRRSSSQAS